jgi:hypothetical protein
LANLSSRSACHRRIARQTVPADAIKDLNPLMTIVGGKIVHGGGSK